jgi:hypothetical protein
MFDNFNPTPKWHLILSLCKSSLRLLAGAALCFGMYYEAGVAFILAEALGIAEELV